MGTYAGAPPGSGKNFAKLSAHLASRGARNPGALAAWIGRRKYGRKGFAKLSHHSSLYPEASMYNFAGADSTEDGMGSHVCPRCGYAGTAGEFRGPGTADGTSLQTQPGELRTPASPKNAAFTGQSITLRSQGGGGGISGFADQRSAIELSRRPPVREVSDIIVSRQAGGNAILRHRVGGGTIGELHKLDDGTWQPVVDGVAGSPSRQQRAALVHAVTGYNRTTATLARPAQPLMPLQGPPPQPEVFSQLGISNVRAFASDGDGDDSGGLSPKGQGIYKKLTGKGVSAKVAMAMAKRAQNFGGAKVAS